jgi:integrase
MAKGRLTVSRVQKSGPGLHSDGDGLYLAVGGAGARSWIFRYRHNGRRRDLGLGPAGVISLAEARVKAIDARRLLAAGIDPIAYRKAAVAEAKAEAARSTTFGAFAESFIEGKKAGWRNPKHAAQWRMTLLGVGPDGSPARHDYCRALRGLPIGAIDVDAVLKVLTPVWQKKPETAVRIRGRIESVLDAAKVRGLREGENPARWKGGLALLLPAQGKVRAVRHHPALPHADVAEFVRVLRQHETSVAAAALEFLILTVVRPGNAVRARWSQIDREAKIWTIPAAEMKGGVAHIVPLSDPVIAVLDRMEAIRRGPFIFPSTMGTGAGVQKRNSHMSDAALATVIDRLNQDALRWIDPVSGRQIVPHGFRSAFHNWASETAVAPEPVLEAVLAHTVPDAVVAAYRRTRFVEQRVAVMATWGQYVTRETGGKIIPFRGA